MPVTSSSPAGLCDFSVHAVDSCTVDTGTDAPHWPDVSYVFITMSVVVVPSNTTDTGGLLLSKKQWPSLYQS
jgi:hypothetical protein